MNATHNYITKQESNQSTQNVDTTYYTYDDYEYLYIQEGFSFERPIYLYVWTILCGIVIISNILILLTLCRSSVRSSTNIVLVAIAIAETLAIVVTVPTFVYTYQQYEPGIDGAADAYLLSKEWCQAFMTSKLYASQAFKTASLWLHCLLGFQRFFSVWFPLQSQSVITHCRTVVVTCFIFFFAAAIHIYHLLNNKATEEYMCVWQLEDNCGFGCAYLWYSLFLAHLIPCIFLVTFTSMLVYRLFKTAKDLRASQMYSSGMSFQRRNASNRSVTKVVVAVVVSLLVPEIPHCVFLTVNAILWQTETKPLPLKTNRALQTSYEVLLACSYCANFWIYALCNKTFQKELMRFLPCFRGRFIPRHSNDGLSQRSIVTLLEKTLTSPATFKEDTM